MPRIIPFSRYDDESNSSPAEALNSHALYPARVPDGEYIVAVTNAIEKKHTRVFGDKIILRTMIIEGEFCGVRLPMYFRISRYPTSRFYRHWMIANGRAPSRNTLMSHRIFINKVFRAVAVTVRPCHRIFGPDGKSSRVGAPLPESCWYSKIDHFLELECENSGPRATNFPPNPLSRD
jgi:hypothetical protein